MTVPRCPFCNAQGLDKLAAKTLGYFSLIYCGQCGAIHGVVPLPPKKPKTKQQARPVATTEQAPASPPAPPLTSPPEKEKTPPSPEEEALSYYTRPGQHGFYTRMMTDEDDET